MTAADIERQDGGGLKDMLRQLESDPGDRLGEHWRVGMNPNTPEAGWTRKDDGRGNDFPPRGRWQVRVVGRVHLLRYADLRRRDGRFPMPRIMRCISMRRNA
jgi:hypothetical protein